MTTTHTTTPTTNRGGVVANAPTDLYVDGSWRPASDGARFDVHDPATAETIATVAAATVDDGLTAVDAGAPSTAPPGPRRRLVERAEILRRAFEMMTERSDEIAELIVRENGKSFAGCRRRDGLRRRVLPLVRRGSSPRRSARSAPPRAATRRSWCCTSPSVSPCS